MLDDFGLQLLAFLVGSMGLNEKFLLEWLATEQ